VRKLVLYLMPVFGKVHSGCRKADSCW
jgi:hypothetical protein